MLERNGSISLEDLLDWENKTLEAREPQPSIYPLPVSFGHPPTIEGMDKEKEAKRGKDAWRYIPAPQPDTTIVNLPKTPKASTTPPPKAG